VKLHTTHLPFPKNPRDLSTYPIIYQEAIRAILRQINGIQQRELNQLISLGVAPPERSKNFIFEPHGGGNLNMVIIKFAEFSYPRHYLFRVPLLFKPDIFSYYFIAYPDVDRHMQAFADYNQGGLARLVRLHPGIWLNRPPYLLFNDFKFHEENRVPRQTYVTAVTDKRTSRVHTLKCEEPPLSLLDPSWQKPELQLSQPVDPELIESFCYHLRFFASLGDDLTPGFKDYRVFDYFGPDEKREFEVPHPVVTRLFLPASHCNPESITLKIIPTQDNRAGELPQLFADLRAAASPLVFELVAEGGAIYFLLTCALADRPLVEDQFRIHFPEFELVEHTESHNIPLPVFAMHAIPESHYEQIKNYRSFQKDPYSQLYHIFSNLSELDFASVRIFFNSVSSDSITTVQKPIQDHIGLLQEQMKELKKTKLIDTPGEQHDQFIQKQTLSDDLKKRIDGLSKKMPAWFVWVTLLASNQETLALICDRFMQQYETDLQYWMYLAGGSRVWSINLSRTPLSSFDQLPNRDRPYWASYQYPWGLVTTEELTALVHFPDKDAVVPGLETASMKSSLPPPLYTEAGIQIGMSKARGKSAEVKIPIAVRDRHIYVVGKSGTGKSTLLYNCIRQDIEQGFGVAVIDPHGDLTDDVLHSIPEHRIKDTIYFNAKDTAHPIGLNVLNAKTEDEIGILADDLLVTFRRLSESWGERMENILRYSFHSLLRYPGATLLDLKTILQRSDFRERIVASLKHPALTDFWQYEYSNYPKDAAQPILNRMSKFTLSPTLSAILGQTESRLNFFEIIQGRKILLVKIAKGEIGEDTAHLLGSLLVSQFQLAVMRRAALPKEDRAPYFLYVDEFQNFTTSAFEKILSEARKYKLCLTLAHQYISQLDEKTKNAILANVGTILMFQSYPADAYALKPELGQYEPTDVTNLSTERHEALCKPATQSKDTFKFTTLAPRPRGKDYAQTIIEQTQQSYSRIQTVGQTQPSQPEVHTQPPQPKQLDRLAHSTARFCPYCGNMLSVIARFCPHCGKLTPGTAQLKQQSTSEPIPEQYQPVIPKNYVPLVRPAPALPKEFKTNQDRILYYLNLAEYLSTKQIITLCYSHLSQTSQKASASRDLKQLVEAKKVKTQFVGKEKIFFVGKSCSPTTHNLAIRELFTKIERSGFEIAKIDFCRKLGGLTPDLVIDFVLPDGQHLSTFWEYDAGTEGIAELESKIVRYTRAGVRGQAIVFVYDAPGRLAQAMRVLPQGACVHAVLGEFESLRDSAFHFAPGHIASLFF